MQIKNIELVEKMKKAGLADKEAIVYVSVLELGGGYPSKVAEYAGLNRTTVYSILATLSIRGLVSEIEKKNKFFYQVEKPEKVIGFAKRQIDLAEEKLDVMKKVLPDIEGLYGALGSRPKITYFEGREGLLSIYQDMIDVSKPYEMLAFSRAETFENFFPEKFFAHFIQTKIQKGITTRGIIPDTELNRNYSERVFKDAPKKLWPERRYVPEKEFMFSGEITIYGNSKVAIVNFKKDVLIGTVIDDKDFHSVMRTIFELSWNSKLVKE